MKTYIFSTPDMCAGILIGARSIKEAKVKIRQYLAVKRLPKYTTIELYTFAL